MNPILHIVMGPNGAGKSTFGSLYTMVYLYMIRIKEEWKLGPI